MNPKENKYPIFEANQVLSNTHLNEVFNYLDEQDRLTRANLIGIGIVCGLEIRLEVTAASTTIHLSKGCGVTSEGYLIVESEDVPLVSYREYKLPSELDYPPFNNTIPPNKSPYPPYPLWEMLTTGDPDTTPLGPPAEFLKDKAVLLFLELKKEGLRNCSANDCNDRGSEVTTTLRPLLIKKENLDAIIAKAKDLTTDLTFADLESVLLGRLKLPDLRLPRYDVPNTGPVTSNQVLAAFHAVFQTAKLSTSTKAALSAAYNAFKPLLEPTYPSDPFANFSTDFGFLDTAPTTTEQVLFLQYYYDLFDDVLKAYDEFRWKGVELMCACCPPEGLFPRHLMLGGLEPASPTTPTIYRQPFLASSAISGCEERAKEVKQLFRRLVEMTVRFTSTPTLPKPSTVSKTDGQIRITPSKLADVFLSDKAIPYYYQQDGTPYLFELWSAEKNRRNRANQNLSYRSDEYTPSAPSFVTDPLHYDLEPYNFLRIEGHVGKNYQSTLNTLLSLKTSYRLPIEIVALRTGAFDETMEVDLTKEECRFQDLETLYNSLRKELSCLLAKQVQYFYDLPSQSESTALATNPKLPILTQYAPTFRASTGTVGWQFENQLGSLSDGKLPCTSWNIIINSIKAEPANQPYHLIAYASQVFDDVSKDLGQFKFDDFKASYQAYVVAARNAKTAWQAAPAGAVITALPPWEGFVNRLEEIIYQCRLEAFTVVHDEYLRRIREVKQKQFLSFFLQKHPGIQHKAGVPLGGTFIIVYHDDPKHISPAPTAGSEADKFIAKTVYGLVGGTVIADFFLPYLCCSDCSPVQFVLPVPPLGLAVQLGCTNAEGNAEAMLTPKGGMAPYTYQLNGQPFQAFTDKVPLKVGAHTFVVRDSTGAESPPQSLNVPATLTIGEETYADNLLTETYQVSFIISGGTTPYKTESGKIVGSTYTSDLVKSRESITVKISDSVECATSKEFTHRVTAPCNLPCAGQSRRCAYRLWLQPHSEGAFYTAYAQQGAIRFRFNGKTIILPNSDNLLSITPEDLNGNFDSAIARAVASLNEAINEALKAEFGQDLGNNRLVLSNPALAGDPALTDPFSIPFAILLIEHFVCETFNIEFDFFFMGQSREFPLTFRYTNESNTSDAPYGRVTLINKGQNYKATQVPAFSCSERNQCSVTDYKKLCEGPDPTPRSIITKNGEGIFSFTGDVEPMDPSEIIGWVWDVFSPDSSEPFYVGRTVNAHFTRARVRLTAITQKGCFGTVDQVSI